MLNVMGYYGLFVGLKYKNTVRVTHLINSEDYSQSETITLKIPLSVPYFGDTEFERVDGEIEHQGQYYRLVKQKLEKDTLHVVCIRDTRADVIHEAIADYVDTFATQSTDRSNSKSIQSFIKDYCASTFGLDTDAAGWAAEQPFTSFSIAVVEAVKKSPSPPPKI